MQLLQPQETNLKEIRFQTILVKIVLPKPPPPQAMLPFKFMKAWAEDYAEFRLIGRVKQVAWARERGFCTKWAAAMTAPIQLNLRVPGWGDLLETCLEVWYDSWAYELAKIPCLLGTICAYIHIFLRKLNFACGERGLAMIFDQDCLRRENCKRGWGGFIHPWKWCKYSLKLFFGQFR